MLRSILIVLIMAVSYSATAAPIQLSHQGRLLDTSGSPVPDGNYSIIYRLYDDPVAGTLLWEEPQLVPVKNGSFTVLLGSVTPLDLSAISQTTPGHKYVDLRVAGDPPMRPRLLLTDVPRAALAGSVQGDISTSPGQLTLSKADAGKALNAFVSPNSSGISIVDTLTGDTLYDMNVRKDISVIAIRRPALSGDTSQIQISVDTGGPDVSLSRVYGPGDAHYGSLRSRSRVGKNSMELFLKSIPLSGDSNSVRVATDTGGIIIDAFSARKVVKFKAGAALAHSVNRIPAGANESGAILTLRCRIARGVEISADSVQAGMLIGDTLGDTGIVIATSAFLGPRVRVKGTDATGKYEEVSLKPNRMELTSTDPSSNRIEFTLNPDRIEMARVAPDGTADTTFSVRSDSSGNVGLDMITARKVVKFKAGAALATKVKKALAIPAVREGASIGIIGQMLRGIELGVDSTQATILFGDTLGDTGILITTSAAGPRMGMQGTNAAREKLILVVKPDRIEIARAAGGGGTTQAVTMTLEAGRMFMVNTAGDTAVILREDGSAKVSGVMSVGTPEQLATLTVGGNICATGTIGACSDSRFKTNVSPITDAMSLLTQLQGVRYDWKRDEFPDYKFSDKRQIGLIAQEVIKVLPEVVQKNDDGYFSIDYGKLTPLLIEALKLEQKATARVTARNEMLSQRVDRLEKLVNKMVSAGENNGAQDLAIKE